jgi:ArsR family transcriptional regulator, virulence genes transcriptional regulator
MYLRICASIVEKLMNIADDDIFKIHADFCACLANEKRLKIMWCLAEGEFSVSELARTLNIPVTNISQHLRVLRDKGAVRMRKDGQQVFYSVTNQKFIQGCSLIREGILETFVQKAKFIDIK